MQPKIPVFKKKVNAFLTSEEGKITKESMLIAGGILAGIAAGSIASKFGSASNYSKLPVCADADETGCCKLGVGGATESCYAHGNSADVTADPSQPLVVQHNHHYNHTSHASHASHGSHGAGCCFPAGTAVLTPSGKKMIEEFSKGDKVSCYDLNKKVKKSSVVLDIEAPVREGYYIINKKLIKVTDDHPFFVKKKSGKLCWAAIDRKKAIKSHKLKGIQKLDLGDNLFRNDGKWVEIKKMEYVKGNIKTYNLSKVKNYNNYFANGFLVHNKYY
jgi:hypothetical protein